MGRWQPECSENRSYFLVSSICIAVWRKYLQTFKHLWLGLAHAKCLPNCSRLSHCSLRFDWTRSSYDCQFDELRRLVVHRFDHYSPSHSALCNSTSDVPNPSEHAFGRYNAFDVVPAGTTWMGWCIVQDQWIGKRWSWPNSDQWTNRWAYVSQRGNCHERSVFRAVEFVNCQPFMTTVEN